MLHPAAGRELRLRSSNRFWDELLEPPSPPPGPRSISVTCLRNMSPEHVVRPALQSATDPPRQVQPPVHGLLPGTRRERRPRGPRRLVCSGHLLGPWCSATLLSRAQGVRGRFVGRHGVPHAVRKRERFLSALPHLPGFGARSPPRIRPHKAQHSSRLGRQAPWAAKGKGILPRPWNSPGSEIFTGPGWVGGATREDPVKPAPAPIAFRSAPPPAPEPGRNCTGRRRPARATPAWPGGRGRLTMERKGRDEMDDDGDDVDDERKCS